MTDIRGLKPLVDFSPEALGILLLLSVLALVGLFVHWALRQKPASPRSPKRSLSIKQRLDLLRSKHPSPELFCATLSEIMRDFLKLRYGLHCRRLTTTEIVEEMRKREIPSRVIEHLEGILEACDLVKFAKVVPDPVALEGHLTTAYLVLEEP